MHRSLDDGGPPPDEWVISRICEEFACLPSEAQRELLDGDATLVLTILEMRAYAATKRQIKDAERESDMPTGGVATMVFQNQHAIMREKRKRREGV